MKMSSSSKCCNCPIEWVCNLKNILDISSSCTTSLCANDNCANISSTQCLRNQLIDQTVQYWCRQCDVTLQLNSSNLPDMIIKSFKSNHIMNLFQSNLHPNPVVDALLELGVTYDGDKEFSDMDEKGNILYSFGEFKLPNNGGTYRSNEFIENFVCGGDEDNVDVNVDNIFDMVIENYPPPYIPDSTEG